MTRFQDGKPLMQNSDRSNPDQPNSACGTLIKYMFEVQILLMVSVL